MVTYEDLKIRNKNKLERVNAPKYGQEIKYLVFDKHHPYENSITKFRKTDLYEEGERNGIHGLHVGTVLKILNSDAILYGLSFNSDFDAVVDYCIKESIRVINTSLSCGYSRKRNEAIKRFAEWGGIWVSASGNESHDPVDFPASSEWTVGVSATNTSDSNGEEVDTTADSYWSVSDQFDRLRPFNGTSGANPVIAEAAGRYLKANPNGDLHTFLNWLDVNEIDDLDNVLDYSKSFGKLEEGERFFVFPDDLKDEGVAMADKFTDDDGKWYEDQANYLADKGIIQGYEDGTLRGDQLITRAEAISMVAEQQKLIEKTLKEANSKLDKQMG